LYISEPQNDFIFSVLAEELGFIGCAVVVILFAIFIWRGIIIAMKAPDMFGSLLAVGITALIGLEAIINIAVVTSSMPVTGMPLPFFSYGGTSLIILLCSVRRSAKYIETEQQNMRRKPMKVIIAAAGTAGHINPGIAIANKIKSENKDAEITFIGTNRGLENDLVPRAGYNLRTIDAYGINRKISLQNIKNIIKTLKGFREAKNIVREIDPDIVIGTGGYICGPVVSAAVKNKIPSMLHESNSYPGMTVRLLSKKVDTILVGFEDAIERLPKAKHVVVTGNPTIKNVGAGALDSLGRPGGRPLQEIKQELGLKNDLPIVLVFGGSQGAKSINEALVKMIEEKLNSNYQIVWATGPKQYDAIKEELLEDNININNIINTKVLPYIYNMEEVTHIADIIVSRSGAMTITEISTIGKPAIFIPFPFATENHQEYNARVLEKAGAAKVILDKDLDAKILTETLDDMLKDKNKLMQMGENAKKLAIPDTLDRIYKEVEKLIR